MVEVFKYVDKFFTSLSNYLTYNDIFLIFVGLFLFTIICVIISTSKAYESKLIKAIDKFNVYFIDNPQINEENLVAFNAKMKGKKVPKQLRKQWQQFVLYREDKASAYMSFENCVSNPIKNSTYKRDIKLMNVLAYIFTVCSLVLNCYYCFETTDVATVLRKVLLTPIIILLLNYLVYIFLNLKHNAIVSDLFQNYQYFEVNIDKATETLPEYVDYEVLFDRYEIKKGIPILYAYLQKRAEEERRELERARLKNVEHEKFNFDDQGVAASLVLERAMQEAENYIAERKKYNQDTQQINSDITQEDMNYREITKEYNRQMQVSKETFANFKSQLEDVSSTIEANYLKKQQQQELDRQRNLERDFDTATERHKKIIESYHAELDTVDKFIAQSRKNLEDAMKSEFGSYSTKVYDEAKKIVDEREKQKYAKLKSDIKALEEKLVLKNTELENAYEQNQVLHEKLDELGVVLNGGEYQQQPIQETQQVFEQPTNEEAYMPEYSNETEYFEEPMQVDEVSNVPVEEISTEQTDDGIEQKVASKRGRPRKVVDATTVKTEAKKRGRPRKEVKEESVSSEPKRGPGRPKKVVEEATTEKKKGPGRPKKVEEIVKTEPAKKRGRPRKEVKEEPVVGEPKRGRGRPKKVVEEQIAKTEPAKKRGRPRKVESMPQEIEDIDEVLKKIDDEIAMENAKIEETQKELAQKAKLSSQKAKRKK